VTILTLALSLFIAALLPLAAHAEHLSIDVVDDDLEHQPIQSTFKMIEGDSVTYYYTKSGPSVFSIGLADSFKYIVPSVIPARIQFQFLSVDSVDVAWIRFKELEGPTTAYDETDTYAWGDWIPRYLGPATYREFEFKVGLWESCAVRVVGSGVGKDAEFYYQIEGYRD